MANAASSLRALNMLLSSQERRQQADIQASLGGMELALKERQAEDLSRHRRATEFIQAGQLAERQLMGKSQRAMTREQIKTSGIIREQKQQEIFKSNLETINAGLDEATIELANNIWYSMGLDELHTSFRPPGGKDIEKSHHTDLINYLKGSNVGFKENDAQMISRWVMGYGSMQKKNKMMMMKLAKTFKEKMSSPETKANHHFLRAAARAGMIANIDEVDPKGKNEAWQSFESTANMLDKARRIREYKAYLRKEEAEVTYQAKKGESKDYEREIRYEFQAPQTLEDISMISEEIKTEEPKRAVPGYYSTTTNIYQTGQASKVDAGNAVKKIQDARKGGDYVPDSDYAQIMGFGGESRYVDYPITGYEGPDEDPIYDYTQPTVMRQQDVSGASQTFDFEPTQKDLVGTKEDMFDRFDVMRQNLNEEIYDARGEINRLNAEGVSVAQMTQTAGIAQEPGAVADREVNLFREQERLRMLNEEQMRLNQKVMKITSGQWDDWTAAFGDWSTAGTATKLRRSLPGSMVTEDERAARRAGVARGGSMSKGQVNYNIDKGAFMASNPQASLQDYLGKPMAKVVVPPIVEDQPIIPSKPMVFASDSTEAVKKDTTYSFPHSMGWFRGLQNYQFGEDTSDKYITSIK